MGTEISSAPAELQPPVIQTKFTRVQYLVLDSDATDYSSGVFKDIQLAIVTDLTGRIGSEPSTATIRLPVNTGPDFDEQFASASQDYDHQVAFARDNSQELAAFGPGIIDIRLWTKIRIFSRSVTGKKKALDTDSEIRVFVGFVTEMFYTGSDTEHTDLILICKNGMELLRKTPAQGMMFWNNDGPDDRDGEATGSVTFIRDREIVFNEGGRPNRLHDRRSTQGNELEPVFCRRDFNRFNESIAAVENVYAADSAIQKEGGATPSVHARKWYSGHIWNYLRNMIHEVAHFGDNRIYNNPGADISLDELPPLRSSEVVIPILFDSGDDTNMWHDLFVPRAFVGQTSQTGLGEAVSGVGEFNPTGLPMNETLVEVLRRVGNYTIAQTYDTNDRLVIKPIRTIKAFTESDASKIGLRGKSGGTGGKKIVLTLPGPGNTVGVVTPSAKGKKPANITSFNIRTTSDSYYNRVHDKAGPIIAQATFTTVARNKWTDEKNTGSGQDHQIYDYAPRGEVPLTSGEPAVQEWLPKLVLPTLVPGWRKQDGTDFAAAFVEKNQDIQHWPDAYATFLVPQDGVNAIDWVAFFAGNVTFVDDNGVTQTVNRNTLPGFRRFFDRDRELMDTLITRVFQTTLGLFRRRPQKLPIKYARAFRGIKLESSGATVYGDPDTEDKPLQGAKDWFAIQADVEVLTDGRLGFRLGDNARLPRRPFEVVGTDEVKSGAVSVETPWSWNGLPEDQGSRYFEMLWTIPVVLDEELWSQIDVPNKTGSATAASQRFINKFGPLLEHYRNSSNEYQYEEAIHSFIPRQNPAELSNMVSIPPVDSTGIADASQRIYNNPFNELVARNRMIANRITITDQIAELAIPFIDGSLWAGDYISELEVAGGGQHDHIKVNAIISSITHNYETQRTTVRLETIK